MSETIAITTLTCPSCKTKNEIELTYDNGKALYGYKKCLCGENYRYIVKKNREVIKLHLTEKYPHGRIEK